MAEYQKKLELDGGRDYISGLPDEILLIILSKLNIVDGARTTLLSSRWRRNLWKLPRSNSIRYDASDFMACYSYSKDYDGVAMNIKLEDIVDQTLDQSTGEFLDELVVSFVPCKLDNPAWFRAWSLIDPDIPHMPWPKVDSWVEFAKKKSVKTLDLSFQQFEFNKAEAAWCEPFLLKSLTSTNFSSLLTLRLKFPPSFTSEWTNILLSRLPHCFPNLEELSIAESASFQYMVELQGSSSLKRLELIGLDIGQLCISAPNLVTFNYVGCLMPEHQMTMMRLFHVPLLAELSYSEFNYSEDSVNEMPIMTNLRILSITLGEYRDDAMRLFFRFLGASPSLRKLLLNLEFISFPLIPNDQLIAINQCLEEVEIDGFDGLDNEVRLVMCLAQFSPALKKVRISPSTCKLAIDKKAHLSAEQHDFVAAVQSLQSRLPPQLEFVTIFPSL